MKLLQSISEGEEGTDNLYCSGNLEVPDETWAPLFQALHKYAVIVAFARD